MKHLGRHVLLDMTGIPPEMLTHAHVVEHAFLGALVLAGVHIVTSKFHQFAVDGQPHGVSGVVVLAQSHACAHTWPEYGCMAVDIFTCGDEVDPEDVVGPMVENFRAKEWEKVVVRRLLRPDFS